MEATGVLILTTAIAGVAGIGLGGFVGTLFGKDSDKTVSLLLSFAGGVMLSIVCFDLIREALETNVGIVTVISAVLAGVLVVYVLNEFLDKKTNHQALHGGEVHLEMRAQSEAAVHSLHMQHDSGQREDKFELFLAGMVMAGAIAIHNLPEGMTIGILFADSHGILDNAVLLLAFLIGLHNIPAGMAISVPLIGGGMSRCRAIAVTALSGIPTVFGALFGYWIGDIGELGLSLSLGFAGGAMLYVVFGEMIPQAVIMYRSKLTSLFIILGMLLGLLIIHM